MIDPVMVSALFFNGSLALISLTLTAVGIATEGKSLVLAGLAVALILGG